MKITNLTSPQGNQVPNQFEIKSENARYFQSYDSIIVKIEDSLANDNPLMRRRITYLDSFYWNYSRTTSKYRNIFLGESTKETEKKIKAGIYILTNLN
jgi:hypothetical protein